VQAWHTVLKLARSDVCEASPYEPHRATPARSFKWPIAMGGCVGAQQPAVLVHCKQTCR
jgi:hypothetical protein